jgi:hypothetical protein
MVGPGSSGSDSMAFRMSFTAFAWVSGSGAEASVGGSGRLGLTTDGMVLLPARQADQRLSQEDLRQCLPLHLRLGGNC